MDHKYFNSIISTHKGRKGSVRAFLRSIFLASKHINKDTFEIVIADLDIDMEVDRIIDSYKDRLNVTHCKIKYGGLFWKSKALNHCASKTQGKYITMLDIDAVVPPLFFKQVEDFYKDQANERVKLCYRVRFLDPSTSKIAMKTGFDESFVNGLIVKHKKFRQAFERYTKDEIKLRGKMTAPQQKWLYGQALGNSHYTMLKEDFMAIGGYDEKFIGWACEDLDFNKRAFEYLGQGTLICSPTWTVFSVHHNRSAWMNRKRTKQNEGIYHSNKKKRIVKLEITDTWGKFNE